MTMTRYPQAEQRADALLDRQLLKAEQSRLFGLACRLLGSTCDAEDMVQTALERWIAADGRLATPAAWLTTVVTNLCFKELGLARRRWEFAAGMCPPEPGETPGRAADPLQTVQQRESVSLALLVLLERLTGPERAVFVLREAFGYPYAHIAQILERTEAGCRQLHRRAAQHLTDPAPGFRTDQDPWRELTERFLAAAADGHVAALEQLLATDTGNASDRRPRKRATRNPPGYSPAPSC